MNRVEASLIDRVPGNEEELEELLSRPTSAVVEAVRAIEGDVVVLGAGGKMGPSLARMLRRAGDAVGKTRRVIAVSRFGDVGVARGLERHGVEVLRADLTDRATVDQLPDAAHVVYMAGQKFGTAAAPEDTWHANVVVPSRVAERYRGSRVAVFSTGNVYPLVPVLEGGAHESTSVAPVGEYAWTCLGRERVFTRAAETWGTRVAIVRLNYAVDLRYGVLVDVALRVQRGEPIDVQMGHVNVIWQGDANAWAIEALALGASPPFVVNVTGGEVLRVRDVAAEFGRVLGRAPCFTGTESDTALLSDARLAHGRFGPPLVPSGRLITWVGEWIRAGGRTLGKATHFEERGGAF